MSLEDATRIRLLWTANTLFTLFCYSQRKNTWQLTSNWNHKSLFVMNFRLVSIIYDRSDIPCHVAVSPRSSNSAWVWVTQANALTWRPNEQQITAEFQKRWHISYCSDLVNKVIATVMESITIITMIQVIMHNTLHTSKAIHVIPKIVIITTIYTP